MKKEITKSEKIKNVIALGVSEQKVTELLNQGVSIEELENFCNKEINANLENTMKELMLIVSDELKNFTFFTILDDDIARNAKISSTIQEKITLKLLERDIALKDIEIVFKSIVEKQYTIFNNAENIYKKLKEDLFAKMMGKEFSMDIRLSDIDKKMKELSASKK